MDPYLWAFVSLLYYIASGRVLLAIGAFAFTGLAFQCPRYCIPILMLVVMYLLLLVVRLVKSLEAKTNQLDECKSHIESLHSRHESFVHSTLSFTTHVKKAFTPPPSDTPSEDKDTLD